MNVTLPDGTVINDVPDGMSKADLTAKLARNGYDVSKLEAKPVNIGRANPRIAMMEGQQDVANLLAGVVRGSGSIGVTLLTPYDLAAGNTSSISNPERRAGMDSGLSSLGADTNSGAYKTGKIGAEIAGTAGAGGPVANILGRFGVAAPLVEAVRTGGMSAQGAGLGTRALGGAITGGATAGMVEPSQAPMGAAIGGAAPIALKGLGAAGEWVGKKLAGEAQSPDMTQGIQAARDAGYVIPPTQAKPNLFNRMLEGYAGKLTTAQNASAKNAEITDALASKALGLPADKPITPEALAGLRKTAGQAYEEISGSGTITPGPAYGAALDKIIEPHLLAQKGFPDAKPSPVIDLVNSLSSPSFDAAAAVAKIKQLRTAADDGFRTGNTDIARASKQAANALEDAVEAHLAQSGDTAMLQKFRDSRELIAKSYSVEGALNKTTGTVDARKLGQQLDKGKPLTNELRTAGEFANRFPKAANTPERMGSLPGNSPLDWGAGGIASVMHGNMLPLVAAVAGRPLARATALSNLVQNRLTQDPQATNKLMQLLQSPEGQQLLYRMAPQAANAR